jgi:N-acylglucosamine 2-epimerase
MILLETNRELALTSDRFDPARAAAIRRRTRLFAHQVLYEHRQTQGDVVVEFLGADGQIKDTMLGTTINPGHTLESMWFVMHYAQEVGDQKMIEAAVATVRRACELGWDEAFGGLLQFAHMEGGRPRGNVPTEQADSAMIHKLRTSWDAKLWWVHSEALYALLLSRSYTHEAWTEEWYRRIHDYTFGTFPAGGQGEEWIAIRDRDGSPSDRIVALPVKDPFHVPRAFMHIIRLLDTPGRPG